MSVLLHLLMFSAGLLLTWRGSGLLERSSERLSERYRLSELVRGTLVVAVGSSFPEVTTMVAAALLHGDFALGMASVVGSAVFNILVIPGVSALRGKPLRYDARLVFRDAQFYLTSVAVLLLAFSFALIYAPTEEGELGGTLTRPIALIPLLLYGLYLFLQHQDRSIPRQERATPSAEKPAHEDGPRGSALRDWLTLGLSLALIIVGVEGLLRTAIWLGEVLQTPSFLWGATVVAAATSVPDLLVSVRSARRGDDEVSVGNVLGSNIFDLLVALPLAVLVAGGAAVDFTVAAPLMGFLTLATIVLFAFMRTGLELTRREALILLFTYALFILWLALETVGATHTLGGL